MIRRDGLQNGVDAVVVCDCVFNYALIQPLVQTCVEICSVRPIRAPHAEEAGLSHPSLCIIAQQLRQPEVFREWLQAFMSSFHVWRLPDSVLSDNLQQGSGFVLHAGILRKADR